MAQEEPKLSITVEFSGGLELLFSKQKTHRIQLPARDAAAKPATISFLVGWLCENLLAAGGRRDMFVVDGTVRNGILVLINDADWELEGEEEYVLEDGDNVLFVSTLHGG